MMEIYAFLITVFCVFFLYIFLWRIDTSGLDMLSSTDMKIYKYLDNIHKTWPLEHFNTRPTDDLVKIVLKQPRFRNVDLKDIYFTVYQWQSDNQ